MILLSYQSIRLVDENRLEEALSECGGGSMITITDITSEGDYEGETVTISKGTYSKSAIIEDGIATIKGFTEIGTVTVSVSDFTTTFNIDKYSKYEVGVGNDPYGNFSYTDWLLSIGESASGYSSLDDVLADEKMVRELFTRHASVDYLVSVSTSSAIATIIYNDYCAKWINLRDYALDTLYADSTIADLMDTADKYFYGEWIIVDNTTTPPTWGPKGNVPVMTSNTAPYGEASASSVYDSGTDPNGQQPYYAFTEEKNYWMSDTVTASTENYIQYRFVNPVNVRRFYLESSSDYYISYIKSVQASNDGINWTQIASRIDLDDYKVTSNINNNNYYLYYRVVVIAGYHSGSKYYAGISTLQFYGREAVSVPIMTSNTVPYGEVTTSGNHSSGNYPGWKAFDGNLDVTSSWVSAGTTNQWIKYKFISPICITRVDIYVNGTADVAFKNFRVEGSNDNSNFTTIYTGKFDNIQGWQSVEFSNNNEYLYYRMFFIDRYATDTRAIQFTELQLYGFDYSEYDWDEDNPKKHIYDHGIELETIIGGIKGNNALTLTAVGTAVATINTTNYTVMGGRVGMRASGTNKLKCGTATSNFSATNMPNGNGIDITNVNGSNAVGVQQTAQGTFDIEEVWIA